MCIKLPSTIKELLTPTVLLPQHPSPSAGTPVHHAAHWSAGQPAAEYKYPFTRAKAVPAKLGVSNTIIHIANNGEEWEDKSMAAS